jgi:uncharacterized protein (DUF433 family)
MIITSSWVSKKANIQGGDACIRNTRIPVWVLVNARRHGATDEQILKSYPSLIPGDLEAAFSYAESNPQEIDSAIRENEEGEEGLVE